MRKKSHASLIPPHLQALEFPLLFWSSKLETRVSSPFYTLPYMIRIYFLFSLYPLVYQSQRPTMLVVSWVQGPKVLSRSSVASKEVTTTPQTIVLIINMLIPSNFGFLHM
jgi:hypothetical protein